MSVAIVAWGRGLGGEAGDGVFLLRRQQAADSLNAAPSAAGSGISRFGAQERSWQLEGTVVPEKQARLQKTALATGEFNLS
jgi:hypothetical protein